MLHAADARAAAAAARPEALRPPPADAPAAAAPLSSAIAAPPPRGAALPPPCCTAGRLKEPLPELPASGAFSAPSTIMALPLAGLRASFPLERLLILSSTRARQRERQGVAYGGRVGARGVGRARGQARRGEGWVGGCVGVSVRVGSMGWLGRAWGASEGCLARVREAAHAFSSQTHAPLRHWCREKNTLDHADAKYRFWVLRPGLGARDKRWGCTRGRVKGCCCWDPLPPSRIFMENHANNRPAAWGARPMCPSAPHIAPFSV